MHEDFQSLTCCDALDANGAEISAFDLVKISDVDLKLLGASSEPDDIAFYSGFRGAIGMVAYGEISRESKYRWCSEDRQTVLVLALRIFDDVVSVYDIPMPARYVTKIERNVDLYAVFGILGGRMNWMDRRDGGNGDQTHFAYLSLLLRRAGVLPHAPNAISPTGD